MRQSRLAVIKAASGAVLAIPTFSGSHAIFGDATQGYIECYSSGTISFPKAATIDVFVLGSGLKGGNGSAPFDFRAAGGAGGKGAVGSTLNAIDVEGEYTITVASNCSSQSTANKSTAFGITANTTTNNGGTGGVSTITSSGGSSDNAKKGTNGTAYPFGETSGTFYKQFGAGGGGGGTGYYNGQSASGGQGMNGSGGTLGGGKGGSGGFGGAAAGSANTGSGGGGGGAYVSMDSSGNYDTPEKDNGGNGGSGIVIIRWGYAA